MPTATSKLASRSERYSSLSDGAISAYGRLANDQCVCAALLLSWSRCERNSPRMGDVLVLL